MMMRIYLAWRPSCRRGTRWPRRRACRAVQEVAAGIGVLKFVVLVAAVGVSLLLRLELDERPH